MIVYRTPVFQSKNDPYDDSTLISEQILTLTNGHPVVAHVWAESGYTFLTYYCTADGIENFNEEDVLEYLQSGGIKLDDKASRKLEINLINDKNQVDCWRVTLVIGETED